MIGLLDEKIKFNAYSMANPIIDKLANTANFDKKSIIMPYHSFLLALILFFIVPAYTVKSVVETAKRP